jgi:hypothetical protein
MAGFGKAGGGELKVEIERVLQDGRLRLIIVSSKDPDDSEGQDGDIWVKTS